MKKIIIWVGVSLGILIVLIGALVGGMHLLGRSRLAQAPAVTVQALDFRSDEAALARGAHIATAISLCTDCHGQSLEGAIFIDEPPIGRVVAPNLTAGQGGIGGTYTDEDWVRAIRHGVGGDGRTLVTMPSNAFAHLSDDDLGALIAYLKSAPPVNNELPGREIIFPGTIFMGVLGYGDMPVSLIDHNAVQTVRGPAPGNAVALGEYLSQVGGCTECHGVQLAGRIEDNGPPPGPNLTNAGEVGNWTEADFISTLRTGTTPEGDNLNPEMMPWPWFANMSDEELQALWLYLQSLPPRNLGENG